MNFANSVGSPIRTDFFCAQASQIRSLYAVRKSTRFRQFRSGQRKKLNETVARSGRGLALPAYWCDDSRFQREDLTDAEVEADETPPQTEAQAEPQGRLTGNARPRSLKEKHPPPKKRGGCAYYTANQREGAFPPLVRL